MTIRVVKTKRPTGWHIDPILARGIYEDIFEMRRQGVTIADIAERLMINDRTVSRTLSRGEAPPRLQQLAMRIMPRDYLRALQREYERGYQDGLDDGRLDGPPLGHHE